MQYTCYVNNGLNYIEKGQAVLYETQIIKDPDLVVHNEFHKDCEAIGGMPSYQTFGLENIGGMYAYEPCAIKVYDGPCKIITAKP